MGEVAYCESCEAKRELVQTVGWQPNVCSECGNAVEE